MHRHRVSLPPNDYPSEDPRYTPDHEWHSIVRLTLLDVLFEFFRRRGEVIYAGGNIFVFYERGNKRRRVVPDLLVAPGSRPALRHNFLLWEEHPLALVLELTSLKSRRIDLGPKFRLYRDTLKVPEYFVFDPFEEYLDPPLCGFRLHRGLYYSIDAVSGRLPSRTLGLHLERAGRDLRLYDPDAGARLPTPEEMLRGAQTARERAEAEIARLRRELDELRDRRTAQRRAPSAE